MFLRGKKYRIWGAYKGWQNLTGKYEWLDRKEVVSYIVKGAICVLLGGFFMLLQFFRFALKLFSLALR